MIVFWIVQVIFLWHSNSLRAGSPVYLPHNKPPAVSLVGGKVDINNQFSSVLVFSKDDKKLSGRCSGTKIAPHQFLTAAHCFVWEEKGKVVSWPAKTDRAPKQLFYSFATKIQNSSDISQAEVKKIYFHPMLNQCFTLEKDLIIPCLDSTPDLAVVELNNSLEFDQAPTTALDFLPVNIGDAISMVGYGFEKELDEGAPQRKFHVSQVVSQEELRKVYVEAANEETLVDDELYFGVLGNSLGEQYANLGSGDSGGPVFRERNGVDYLVGVNSFTFCPQSNPDCEVTSNSFFGRVHAGGKYSLGEWLSSLLKPGRF